MKLDGVETFYPLSSLQQGLLFESLLRPSSGAYFNQMIASVSGAIDVDAWRTAWQEVASRHAILRTSFVWEGIKEPVQVVERSVELGWQIEDWLHVEEPQQARRLEPWAIQFDDHVAAVFTDLPRCYFIRQFSAPLND